MAAKLVRIMILGGVFLLAATACIYDLDVTGVIYVDDNANERYNESLQWNTTHPPKTTGTVGSEYTVLFGGDSHVGGTENLTELIDITYSSNALAMVIAGDVTTGKSEDYKALDSILREVANLQTCLVVGNHDLYFDGWNSFHEIYGSSSYTMEVITPNEEDLFIFLDTGSGTLGSLQLEWLKILLEFERESYRHVIITTHLNFFRNRMTGSTNPLNEELLVLLDLFEKHKVDLLISGHDHDHYIEVFGHTTYITLDAMLDGVEQASYMKLTVNADGLNYEFIKF